MPEPREENGNNIAAPAQPEGPAKPKKPAEASNNLAEGLSKLFTPEPKFDEEMSGAAGKKMYTIDLGNGHTVSHSDPELLRQLGKKEDVNELFNRNKSAIKSFWKDQCGVEGLSDEDHIKLLKSQGVDNQWKLDNWQLKPNNMSASSLVGNRNGERDRALRDAGITTTSASSGRVSVQRAESAGVEGRTQLFSTTNRPTPEDTQRQERDSSSSPSFSRRVG